MMPDDSVHDASVHEASGTFAANTATGTPRPQKDALRQIAWSQIFPWLILVRAVRMALRARSMLLGTLGVLATIGGWWLIGALFERDNNADLSAWIADYASCPWTTRSSPPLVGYQIMDPGALLPDTENRPHVGRYPANPLLGTWDNLSAPARQLFLADLSWIGLAFVLLCLLWSIAVWGFFGGAITRMAAVQVAREEIVPLSAAARHARRKWFDYFTAPLYPLLGVLLFSLPAMATGLLLRADVGVLVAAILWPILLVCSLLCMIFLIGLMFGWPLMWPTIATESTDSFDALSRSFSYVYQRPLQYLFYAVVAAFLGALGWLFVAWFAEGVIHVTAWAAHWTSGNFRLANIIEAPTLPADMQAAVLPSSTARAGAHVIAFWHGLVRLVALGFVFSYFWNAATCIYFLLRHDVDGFEMDEVELEGDQAAHGLPPLKSDAAGVATVADVPPASTVDDVE